LDFNKAIEIQPKYADAYNSRGSIYVAKGRMDLAFLDYSKAIEAILCVRALTINAGIFTQP